MTEPSAHEPTAHVQVDVDAPVDEVWNALVDPASIKQYFMGTTVHTNWKVGSPITWSGEWNGKPFEDRGEILAYEPRRRLSYSHWSPLAGGDDTPEHHHVVTTTLHEHGRGTTVELTQSNRDGSVTDADREHRADYETTWMTMLEGLKRTVERRPNG
jgi:uncharacterized protein YndB with AHSA1/START domain